MKKKLVGRIIVIVSVFIGLVLYKNITMGSEPMKPSSDMPNKLSVWVTYWDLEDAQQEVAVLRDHLESLHYFAAYFNSENQVFIPEELTKLWNILKEDQQTANFSSFITIVNDKLLDNETSSLKDTDLLYALFSDETTMQKHIEEIVTMAITDGFDGIEIDYEAKKNDMILWELFLDFSAKLYIRTSQEHLELRILLEPNTPFEKLQFPTGPEYVMMCYNLYGPSGEAGPKADDKFLQQLVRKMDHLPGRKIFALATGGFDWNGDKSRALTENAAVGLLNEMGVKEKRDQQSQALTFEYRGADGNTHQVWYADGITIKHWMNVIEQMGDYGISIWRLVGNRTELWF